ncbi:ubiquinol-cytochrome-c reductase complex assembly factor 3 [Sarcophilus harrisii]|uniref:Ubiquinol-cytochrome-c reductase complex assembly factor 3 n=1 Tax=Sarcophilus harrisii TaxID=9305 RepID=A0A7N4NVN2_SARHA|nr:ubiquinol-cytochrome-c reductase complex assembly factor 3 [Sarcophilus harrisii]
MGSLFKALQVAAVLGAGGGLGVFLFVLVTPGEQRTRELLKEIPEGNPQRWDEATKTKMLLLDTLREATETHENVAWRKDWNRREGGRAA